MAASSFDVAVAHVLRHEGGYVNHPADPGGPTNFGITLATYRRFVNRDATAADIRAMPVETARRIYRAQYWNALRCDALPAGVDYAVFDYAVNSGTGRAGRALRAALGLPVSSHAVTAEVAAAAASREAAALIALICDQRLAFLKRLRTWPTFGRGWERRVAELRRHALALAAANPRISEVAVGEDAPARRGVSGILAAIGAAFAAAGAALASIVGDPLALAALAVAAASILAAALLLRRDRQRVASSAARGIAPSPSPSPAQGD